MIWKWPPPILTPLTSTTVGSSWNLRFAFLNGSLMRVTRSTMDKLSSISISTLLTSPMRPMMVWNSPCETWQERPMLSNHLQRLSRCSGVVPFFKTAIM